LLPVVVAVAVPALRLERYERVDPLVQHPAEGAAELRLAVTAAVDEYLLPCPAARRRRHEVDRTAERARAVLHRIGAARDRREPRAQRVDEAVVVVAVRGGDRQAVLQQLDAVEVIVNGIEIRAAAREERVVV